MSTLMEVTVPDLGDSQALPVIQILVKPGDWVEQEDALCIVESDKATLDIPSPTAGRVTEIRITVGDKVAKGDLLLTLEPAGDTVHCIEGSEPSQPDSEPTPVVVETQGTAELTCDVLVLGGGPGGYSAAYRAADLGQTTILVERHSRLGGVCLNVGCIPSKALLHVASLLGEMPQLDNLGVKFTKPEVDLPTLRAHKDTIISRLTDGLASMARGRRVRVVQGTGTFLDAYHLSVTSDGKTHQTIRFKRCIIAAGSEPISLPFLPVDERIVDSTGALALPSIPERMLVIGGGIIGLEMATIYAALGTRLDIVELSERLMPGPDADLVRVWEKYNAKLFQQVMLKTRTTSARADKDGIWVEFAGDQAPAQAQRYDLVLVAAGRRPNGHRLALDKADIEVNEHGFIAVDNQQRTRAKHIFAIGDIVGGPMLAHKAVHEGHVAAEVAAGEATGDTTLARSAFDPIQIPGVAYTNPEVAWAGLTESEAKAQGKQVHVARFPWAASGRALANGRPEGMTKLLFDAESRRLLGGGIVGTSAGDLISEICLAIEMGADATDIGKTIHPHPTLGESIGMAAEVAEGTCTDLPSSSSLFKWAE